MPVYNVDRFIVAAIQSVLDQNYPNLELFIFNDGSTDKTLEEIQTFLEKRPDLKAVVHLKSTTNNQGVSQTRTELIKWSKSFNPQAYIFWLDADDQYTTKTVISDIITQMQKTKADICLFNFSMIYEDEEQKINALGLVKEKEKMAEILKEILSSPAQSISPTQFPNLLELTSLGCTKCYAPTVEFPKPAECSFEDFVYMASLLEANIITALPVENEPIQCLQRSTSIRGQRRSKNFTHDIPTQLIKFFDTVLAQSVHIPNGFQDLDLKMRGERPECTEEYMRTRENNSPNCSRLEIFKNQVLKDEGYRKNQLQKVKMAQGFVLRKLAQYSQILRRITDARSHEDIDQRTLVVYNEKAAAIESYMDNALKSIAQSMSH